MSGATLNKSQAMQLLYFAPMSAYQCSWQGRHTLCHLDQALHHLASQRIILCPGDIGWHREGHTHQRPTNTSLLVSRSFQEEAPSDQSAECKDSPSMLRTCNFERSGIHQQRHGIAATKAYMTPPPSGRFEQLWPAKIFSQTKRKTASAASSACFATAAATAASCSGSTSRRCL
eukprot:3206681-Amphidinium_carterae.1